MRANVVGRLGLAGIFFVTLVGAALRPDSLNTAPSAAAADAPAPDVALAETVTATRVACGGRGGSADWLAPLDCWLAGLLLPPAELGSDVTFVAQNQGAVSATFGQASVMAVGARSGQVLGEANLTVVPVPSIEPGKVGTVSVKLLADPEPDRYAGRVSIAVPGAESPAAADLDLTIRRGPLVPLALLAIGLALGLLMRKMQGRWRPQADAVARGQGLLRQAGLIRLSKDEFEVLASRLRVIRGLIAGGRTTEADAGLDSVEDSIRLYDLFASLELQLAERNPQDPGVIAARAKITEGRTKLRVGVNGKADVEGASQLYEQACADALHDYGPPLNWPDANSPEGPIRDWRDVRPRKPAAGESIAARESRGLDRLPGLRLPITVVLMALALITGLLTLYVAPAAGFIGSGVGDAASLLLWGVGSGWVDKVFFGGE